MRIPLILATLLCASPAWAACAYNATSARADVSSGNLTLNAPASPATNDIWIAVILSRDNVSHSMDAAWTNKVNENGSTATNHLSVWYFRYAGSTPTMTVTHTAGDSTEGAVVQLRGCIANGDPVDTVGSFFKDINLADTTIPSITPTVANTLLLAIDGVSDNLDRDTLPTDFTAAFSGDGTECAGTNNNAFCESNGGDNSVSVNYKSHTTGATGTAVSTHGCVTCSAIGVLIAIKPPVSVITGSPIFFP